MVRLHFREWKKCVFFKSFYKVYWVQFWHSQISKVANSIFTYSGNMLVLLLVVSQMAKNIFIANAFKQWVSELQLDYVY